MTGRTLVLLAGFQPIRAVDAGEDACHHGAALHNF
jgi:hypothetical protein